MRYLIIENGEVFAKFEIDKDWLVKVKNGFVDLIVDTEENLYFKKDLWDENDTKWHEIKPYDKRFEK